MKVVIMAGGRGTRISSIAPNIPKPMIKIDGIPVLEREINSLKEQATSVDSIIEILKSDKVKNMQDKVAFVERKKQQGVSFVTSRFDKKEKMLDLC